MASLLLLRTVLLLLLPALVRACAPGLIACGSNCIYAIGAPECGAASGYQNGGAANCVNSAGPYCEADGECGTGDVNNCGVWDIWRVVSGHAHTPHNHHPQCAALQNPASAT